MNRYVDQTIILTIKPEPSSCVRFNLYPANGPIWRGLLVHTSALVRSLYLCVVVNGTGIIIHSERQLCDEGRHDWSFPFDDIESVYYTEAEATLRADMPTEFSTSIRIRSLWNN